MRLYIVGEVPSSSEAMTFVYQIKKDRESQRLHLIEAVMQVTEEAIEPFRSVWIQPCLMGLKSINMECHVYVLEADGKVWAVHEDDINESCARCRGVDKTNWSLYKTLLTSGQVAPSVLSVLAQDDELEDPNCVIKFGKRLPLVGIDENTEVRIIYNESCEDSDDLQPATSYAQSIIKRCWKL